MDDKKKKEIVKSIAKLQAIEKILFMHKQLLGVTGRNAAMQIENVIEKLQGAITEPVASAETQE